MHPAFSVIFFTTASGAGYGLLIMLGLGGTLGLLPQNMGFALTAMFAALALVSGGLLSSMLHLGHPERAWRAFSQWRTSWLAREGVLAMIAYVPALVFGLAWAFPRYVPLPLFVLGPILTACCFATLFTTSMIYRSLKPIRAWHNTYVVPSYLLLGPMTGAVFLLALMNAFGLRAGFLAPVCGLLLAAGLTIKWLYWSFLDKPSDSPTAGSALGLPGAEVRILEWPHTEENYVLKEMGFRIARKHATRLRALCIWLGFLMPTALIEATIFMPHLPPLAFTLPAALLASLGIVLERWLFFAEARHAVTLYYHAP